MKKNRLFIIYLLITGISLSFGFFSYLNQRNRALGRIAGNINTPDAKVVVSAPVSEESVSPYLSAKANDVFENKEEEDAVHQIQETVSENAEDEYFALPVGGTAITPFSKNRLVFSESTKDFRTHEGLDFEAEDGETVLAVKSGTVSEVNDITSLGKTVKVDHKDGLQTVYSCLGEASVKEGDAVEKGDVLGTVGKARGSEAALGTHLHFEAIRNGEKINPEELFIE